MLTSPITHNSITPDKLYVELLESYLTNTSWYKHGTGVYKKEYVMIGFYMPRKNKKTKLMLGITTKKKSMWVIKNIEIKYFLNNTSLCLSTLQSHLFDFLV